ncbi:MAG TPA: MraY family glycosyltransferase, partial [Candidatus Methylomirabilis sp.]|nr:MraY family glycosyltransferase [Candidatus Methylomirabilis sp.]
MELQQALPLLVLLSIVLSASLTPLVRRFAFSFGAVDRPTGGRKIHKTTTALWGGLATGTALVVSFVFLFAYVDGKELRDLQLIGFIVAILILMTGGLLDDRFNLKPWQQFLFPFIASFVVVASGSGIAQVSNPFGPGALSLVWIRPSFTWMGMAVSTALPADIVTILWLLTVTYAMKFLDGLDGLVAGLTVISGALIAALASSEAYFQPLIALMALMVASVHLGFLGYNRHGSIFLGEAGSTIAGFS